MPRSIIGMAWWGFTRQSPKVSPDLIRNERWGTTSPGRGPTSAAVVWFTIRP